MLTLKVGEMKNFILILILTLPLNLGALELKVGDILLQPRNCWSCKLIEAQENSIYSHMAMVIETEPTLKVIDALGTVKISEFSEFDYGTDKERKISVRRFQNINAVDFIQNNKAALFNFYQDEFDGLKYDHDFLWNNYDENGKEKIYCSELVTKLLESFLNIKLPR